MIHHGKRTVSAAWSCLAAALLLIAVSPWPAAAHKFLDESTTSATARQAARRARLEVDIIPFEPRAFDIAAGEKLIVEQTAGKLLVQHVGVDGRARKLVTLRSSPARREQQARFDAMLSGTELAKPGVAVAHPTMQQVRTP